MPAKNEAKSLRFKLFTHALEYIQETFTKQKLPNRLHLAVTIVWSNVFDGGKNFTPRNFDSENGFVSEQLQISNILQSEFRYLGSLFAAITARRFGYTLAGAMGTGTTCTNANALQSGGKRV